MVNPNDHCQIMFNIGSHTKTIRTIGVTIRYPW